MDMLKINAVMWTLGLTESEAKEYIRNAGDDILTLIVNGYKNQCSKAFYCD